MARISLPSPAEMNAQQRAVYEEVIAGPRGRLVGPLRAVIHSPDLAARWSRLGEFLRYSTCLPPKLKELAILIVGRRWNSQVEFHIHAEAAEAAGLHVDYIEDIRLGRAPRAADVAETEIYEFARELLERGNVSDETHGAILARWSERGVVELTALIGYYSMVSMMLNAQDIPLPDNAQPPLDQINGDGLTSLPQAGAPRHEGARLSGAARVV